MSKLEGILGQIQDTLTNNFDLPVYYARVFQKKNTDWNYLVFNKKYFEKSGRSNCDFNYYYQVHIIMENYIPEGFEQKIIKAIRENTNLKLVDSQLNFQYTMKNNTDIVIEMLTLEFTRPLKGCDV